jgi:energy-converting hydrogenase Eha subunit E
LLEHSPGSELAIATAISGAERHPVCKHVGQHVSVLGVSVCALADTESLPQLDLSVSLVMEQIDCLEVRVKVAEITRSKFLMIMRRSSGASLSI